MKKPLSLLLIFCMLTSCKESLTRPLKGKYANDYTAVSDTPPDQVWNNIIEYCSKNGLKIKLVDRKSGLIISQPIHIRNFTFENQDGTPKNISSHVILGCETVGFFTNECLQPTEIRTNIIFKLKEVENKTSIKIRLSELVAWYTYNQTLKEVRSTGFLEKEIIDIIK